MTGLSVEYDAGLLLCLGGALIGDQQCLLDRVCQYLEGNLLLTLQHSQNAQVDVHQSSSLLLRLNSI